MHESEYNVSGAPVETLARVNIILAKLIRFVCSMIKAVFRKSWDVLTWFFSVNFAKFIGLLFLLFVLFVAFMGIAFAPYVASCWLLSRSGIPSGIGFLDQASWQWILNPGRGAIIIALVCELVWLTIAGYGIFSWLKRK